MKRLTTFVASPGPPLVVARMMSNIFTAPSQRTTKVAAMIGPSIGRLTDQRVCHHEAPSTLAASKTSLGSARSAAAAMRATKGTDRQVSINTILTIVIVALPNQEIADTPQRTRKQYKTPHSGLR